MSVRNLVIHCTTIFSCPSSPYRMSMPSNSVHLSSYIHKLRMYNIVLKTDMPCINEKENIASYKVLAAMLLNILMSYRKLLLLYF
jgi:hypothetical protein